MFRCRPAITTKWRFWVFWCARTWFCEPKRVISSKPIFMISSCTCHIRSYFHGSVSCGNNIASSDDTMFASSSGYGYVVSIGTFWISCEIAKWNCRSTNSSETKSYKKPSTTTSKQWLPCILTTDVRSVCYCNIRQLFLFSDSSTCSPLSDAKTVTLSESLNFALSSVHWHFNWALLCIPIVRVSVETLRVCKAMDTTQV